MGESYFLDRPPWPLGGERLGFASEHGPLDCGRSRFKAEGPAAVGGES
ncbi:hypothetical protein ACH34W_50015 [Actinomadura sp. 6N118]